MDAMLSRLWGARHGRLGSGTGELLSAAMRAGQFSRSDLGEGRRTFRAVKQMSKRGYIERVGLRSAGCRYRVTLRGRCQVACSALRLRFVSLCVLAEARAMHAMQDECGAAREYPVCLLETSLEGLYAAKTVRNAASALCSAGLAEPVRDGVIRLRAGDFGGFEPVLDELHEWTAGVRDRISMAALGDWRAVAALRGGARR